MRNFLKMILVAFIAIVFCADGYSHPVRRHGRPVPLPPRYAPARIKPKPERRHYVSRPPRKPVLIVNRRHLNHRSTCTSEPVVLWHSPNLALEYARKSVKEYLPHPDIFKETGYNVVFNDDSQAYVVDYWFECADAYGEMHDYWIQMLIRVRLRTPDTFIYELLDIKDMNEY